MKVNITGMNISIFCCAGSAPADGVSFCCHNWLAPIRTGVT